jgi:isopentenyl phosphate kinase
LIVVKLGGSLVTFKDRAFTPRISWLESVLPVLARYAPRLLLVIGGGSYGHYAVSAAEAEREDPSTTVALASYYMTELSMLVADMLMLVGLKPVIYPPHAFCDPVDGRPRCRWGIVAKAVEAGLTPVTHGDTYPTASGYTVISGDELAIEAACSLRARRVIFLSNVDGVLDDHGNTIPVLTGDDLRALIERGLVRGSAAIDVTGGMRRKLEAIVSYGCPGLEVQIVNGAKLGNVERALRGEHVGTLIRLG